MIICYRSPNRPQQLCNKYPQIIMVENNKYYGVGFFWLLCMQGGILVPQSGIEFMPLAVESQS